MYFVSFASAYSYYILVFYCEGIDLMPIDTLTSTTRAAESAGAFSDKITAFFEKLPNFSDISEFFSKATEIKPGIVDILDIIVVAFIIYNATKLIRETRAFQLVNGIVLMRVDASPV